jgi:Tfp pilus assembly protein PilX
LSNTHNLEYQSGAILVISLIMTLVMTTMGMGLYYAANQNTDQVDNVTNRSETLFAAETCVDEAVRWLDAEAKRLDQVVPKSLPCEPCPTCTLTALNQICHTIGAASGDKRLMGTNWRMPGEISSGRKDKLERIMNAHQYDCDLRLIAKQTGASTEYIYKIESRGIGPKSARTDLEVIASIKVGGGPSDGGSDIGQGNEYKVPGS